MKAPSASQVQQVEPVLEFVEEETIRNDCASGNGEGIQWRASKAQPDIFISLAYHGPSRQRGCRAWRNSYKAGRGNDASFARGIFLALHQWS